MRTWEAYKKHVRSMSPEDKKDMEQIEELTAIVAAMIRKRTEMGISQRKLAEICSVPQSSVARIEAMKTTPKLDTLLKLMQPLGLKLKVAVY